MLLEDILRLCQNPVLICISFLGLPKQMATKLVALKNCNLFTQFRKQEIRYRQGPRSICRLHGRIFSMPLFAFGGFHFSLTCSCITPIYFVLSQDCFGYSGSLVIPYVFQNQFINFYKMSAQKLYDCIEFVHQLEQYCHLINVNTKIYRYEMFFQ